MAEHQQREGENKKNEEHTCLPHTTLDPLGGAGEGRGSLEFMGLLTRSSGKVSKGLTKGSRMLALRSPPGLFGRVKCRMDWCGLHGEVGCAEETLAPCLWAGGDGGEGGNPRRQSHWSLMATMSKRLRRSCWPQWSLSAHPNSPVYNDLNRDQRAVRRPGFPEFFPVRRQERWSGVDSVGRVLSVSGALPLAGVNAVDN